jgi:hypothetical protein
MCKLRVKQADFNIHAITDSDARDLVKRLLDEEPRKRIGANGFKELLDHPFFSEIAWEDLENGRLVSPLKGKISAGCPETMGFFELKADEPMSLDDIAGSQIGVEVSYTAVFNPQYLDKSQELFSESEHKCPSAN